MPPSPLAADADAAQPDSKRQKRTYRACYPCRARKLKCNFGDPDNPSSGPCARCIRESRECVRSMPAVVRYAVPSNAVELEPAAPSYRRAAHHSPPPASPYRPSDIERGYSRAASPTSLYFRPREAPPSPAPAAPDDDDFHADTDTALVSSHLQNPNDALRLLASASSLRYTAPAVVEPSPNPSPDAWAPAASSAASPWMQWEPVLDGALTEHEARALLNFFVLRMSPLYPLVHPHVFGSSYLDTLVQDEGLLLGSIIAIASRYSDVLTKGRAHRIHADVSQWVRSEISRLMDGDLSLRTVSTVEALLLLSEWPMLTDFSRRRKAAAEPDSEEARLLQPSQQYDAYCWTSIGSAVRLAQELDLKAAVFTSDKRGAEDWRQDRVIKTWIYCLNAEQHIASRLGRSAVMQPSMTSRWWESLAVRFESVVPTDRWGSEVFAFGNNAHIMGAIQQHLYWSKEITNTLLQTGDWEAFLRSLHLDMRYIRDRCTHILKMQTIASDVLSLEFHYIVLYSNSLALRSYQQRRRRALARKDPAWETPFLLNAVEGPWVYEAVSAARQILDITLDVLEKEGKLRTCPSRIFQHILFATTFLYKALAVGVVQHGMSTVISLLGRTVSALQRAAIDDQHFIRGFAVLLSRLGKRWKLPRTDLDTERGSGGSDAVEEPAAPPPPPPVPDPEPAPFANPGFSPSDFAPRQPWDLPAADHLFVDAEQQDVLFQPIWDAQAATTVSTTSGLYATLLGDILNLEGP
ncbi:hypothetical protein Q8F55_008438 [Vanrija albida]|uniref:Zn(2)-C6 fungal-type domain-containing protein n=1 Tax=Vanrija albida TaxID=181172 RepID=A0ABR3PQU3_9TREE